MDHIEYILKKRDVSCKKYNKDMKKIFSHSSEYQKVINAFGKVGDLDE